MTSETVAARPIIKWAGGKTKLLSELLTRVPSDFSRYYEPFCGGAALFFELSTRLKWLSSWSARPVIGDANPHLMGTYKALVTDVEAVIASLEVHKANHRSDWYANVRDAFNAGMIGGESNKAAAFLYLNRACFNGLWRVNGSGEFNVPMGDQTSDTILRADELRAASRALTAADVRCGDYRETCADAQPGDFVYFDPPYDTEDGFTAFTSAGFGRAEQDGLAKYAVALRSRGVHVMLSNSATTLVRRLYRGWKIERVHRPGTMSSDPKGRGKVREVIVTPK